MRHVGHGVGHLQYDEHQHEVEPDTSMALDDVSDSDKNDTEDSDPDELEIVHNRNDKLAIELDEEMEEYSGGIVDDDDDDDESVASDITVSDSDSDADGTGSDLDGYASY